MELMKSYVTKNECYQVARKITPKGLMLHSVGVPQPSAKVFATSVYNQYMPNGYEVCVHAFLQSDGKVYQTLPWNYEGWHAGGGDKGSANKTHIGVEMCEPDTIKYTGGASFKVLDAAKAKAYVKGCYETAVELFAYLCDLYDLNPLADGVIISHAEGYKRGIASGHADPEHLWKGLGMGYTMDGFRKAVKAKMGGTATEPDKPTTPADTSTAVHYTAQVNASSGLNVRKGPGTSYSVLRALPNGTKVTVTKEQNGWGYIGDGWVSLEWVKKIADVAAPAFTPYLFRITCDVLNIRSGPGTNYPVIGQIKDKKRYTIVEEKTGPGSAKGWGRLKAGGWVARDWIKKA